MAIGQRTATQDSKTSASNTHTVTKPTGLANGDVVHITLITNGATVTGAPSGFSAIASVTTQANPKFYGYRKVITDAAGEGAWTFNLASSVTSGSTCQAFTGVDNTTPEDTVVNTGTGANGSSTCTVTGVTTTVDGAVLLYAFGVNSSTNGLTAPSGMTQIAEGGARKHEMDYENRATAGATGDRAGVAASNNLAWAAYMTALRPASSSLTRTISSVTVSVTETKRSVPATAAIEASNVISGNGLGHWRWYTDATPDGSMSALASEDATPTLTGVQVMGGIIRLRTQLRDTGNITALHIEYSVDGTNWADISNSDLSGVTNGANRWVRWANGAATAGNTIGSNLLSETTSSGTYHESRGASETVGAGAIRELDIAVKIVWPPPSTTVKFRLLDGATPIALATGATNPQFTTCAPADRNHTIVRAEPNTSAGQNREMNHSFWPRLHFDGKYWWFFTVQPDDGTNITYYRWDSSNLVAASWTEATQAMTGNAATTAETDVKHSEAFAVISGTHVVGVFWYPSTGNMRYKRGRMVGGIVSWNSEIDIGAARYGSHSHTCIDDGGFHWIGGIDGTTGVWACRSTAADDGGAIYNPSFGTISTRRKTVTDTVSAGDRFALVPIASDKVLVLWNHAGTLRWATCTDASGFSAVATVNSTLSAHEDDWGVTRIGNTVYVVHSDSTTTGGTWRTRTYSISGNAWSAGTDPGGAQPTQNSNADGLVLTNDGFHVYAFGTTVGTDGGQDRTVTALRWNGSVWTNLGVVTPSGGRGNGDDICGPDVAGGGIVPIGYLFNDCDINGMTFTYEYHVLQVAHGATWRPKMPPFPSRAIG